MLRMLYVYMRIPRCMYIPERFPILSVPLVIHYSCDPSEIVLEFGHGQAEQGVRPGEEGI